MNAVTHHIDRHGMGNSSAFSRLLEWLDDGHDTQGARYLEMRQRLIDYFDRRGRPDPDILTDEALRRISRTLEESSPILVTPPARYCYVVARLVLLEDIRRAGRNAPFDEVPQAPVPRPGARDHPAPSPQCVGTYLDRLPAADRNLVVEYYRETKGQRIDRRQAMAARLGITANALGIRASRLRASLERCVDPSENL